MPNKTGDSQLDVLLDDIDRMADCFDMTKDQLGTLALDLAAIAILVAMDAEEDPEGKPWAPLSAGYQAWKDYVAPGAPISVLTGQMKQLAQLQGERTITPDEASSDYGLDWTLRNRAVRFQLGGLVTGTNQPMREFYAFTALAVQWADHLFEAQFSACT